MNFTQPALQLLLSFGSRIRTLFITLSINLTAVSCAERGLKAHLLLRGEQPQILTGYNLISMLYGSVTYVPRSIYANREELLSSHANSIGGSVVSPLDHLLKASANHNSMKSKFIDTEKEWSSNSKKTIIINEGAGDAIALPGPTWYGARWRYQTE
ncbi:hypothetical protein SSX86_020934 [Deinandra increscens subsp. villosa]|uniref:Uncharacterized protein n=1 Tax=Deinandra increscens subsp. villosa TaxID=3103831 RepID=A0AAP0CTP1_9ASTR